MKSRVSRLGLAVLASLTVAGACLAAEPAAGPGKAGFGGQIGGSTFALDRAFGKDWFVSYSDGASPRLSFDAHWRYQFTNRWRGQIATGFTWAGYSGSDNPNGPDFPAPFPDPNSPTDDDKKDYLTLMLPVSLQLHYVGKHEWWAYHVGGGPGVYRVWIENHRKVLKDPVTLKLHRGLYPGYSLEIGAERWLKGIPEVSLEFAIANHLAMAQRHDQFKSGFDSNVMATEFRIGGNYYFTPGPRKAGSATPAKSP
jgi:hypothetical protein